MNLPLTRSVRRPLRAMVIALPLALGAAFTTTAAHADDAKRDLFITVQGIGNIAVAPDQAMISGGVISEAATAAEALAANSKALAGVVEKLKAAGVAEKDMQTNGFSVQPKYTDYGKTDKAPVIDGYQVSNSISIKVRDMAKLGELLDAMVASGSNAINGVSFIVSDADKRSDDARKAAVADARRKAELYAAAAGVKLGKVLSMSEGGAAVPQPMYRMAAMSAEAMPPMLSGEETLSASVTIVYELAD
ncbi:MAG: SIMPL domain-containing protein [Pannonibacter sp.]